MVYDLIGSCGKSRPILPRSRHLPVAVTDGSLTQNFNEIAVRLWTDSSGAPALSLFHRAKPLLLRYNQPMSEPFLAFSEDLFSGSPTR